jgi:hypothetical protein
MASLDSLNDRQRAVLQLLLRQGKSYDDLAGMLKMDTAGVRRRARGAVAAISPDAGEIGDDRRDEIADYLLGQQTAAQRAATLEYLQGSAAGRAWARAAADALRPVGGTLPDVPAERAEVADEPGAPAGDQAQARRSSQLRSRLLFAGLGVVLALAIILAMSLGGGDEGGQASTTPATALTTPTGDKLEVVAQGSLGPPKGSTSRARGTVAIVRFPESGQYRFGLDATGLAPSSPRGSAYGVWLFTSQDRKRFLGFPDMRVARDGKLQTVSDLPPDTPIYAAVLLTRETSESPKRPGTIVLAARMITAADVAQEQRRRQQQQGRTQTQTTP